MTFGVISTGFRVVRVPDDGEIQQHDVAASSIPLATFQYISSLEWIRAAESVCMIGPSSTGKSHALIALGIAAVEHGHRVRYFTAAEPVETLYRGLADNSVGKVIQNRLRNDPSSLMTNGLLLPVAADAAEGLCRLVDDAYEKRLIVISSNPAPRWVRRAHAQDAGHRHRRRTPPPRPRLPDRR